MMQGSIYDSTKIDVAQKRWFANGVTDHRPWQRPGIKDLTLPIPEAVDIINATGVIEGWRLRHCLVKEALITAGEQPSDSVLCLLCIEARWCMVGCPLTWSAAPGCGSAGL